MEMADVNGLKKLPQNLSVVVTPPVFVWQTLEAPTSIMKLWLYFSNRLPVTRHDKKCFGFNYLPVIPTKSRVQLVSTRAAPVAVAMVLSIEKESESAQT